MLTVQGLTKTYYSRGEAIEAVKGIDFQVEESEIFGLLGPNGAGKTTTVKMVCGLVRPDAGRIEIERTDFREDPSKCKAKIGAVLEGARNIYWRLSAWENLMLFGARRELPKKLREQRAQELLSYFNLYDRKDTPTGDLSRGMQQKVALACTLIADPPLLLLDEPTIGLDVHSAELLKQKLKELARGQGKAILLTTHQMELAEELCHRVGIIHEGKLLLCQKVEELKQAFSQRVYVLKIRKDQAVKLEGLPGNIQEYTDYWELRAQLNSNREIFRLFQLLEERNVELLAINTEQPDLKEIFIQLTKP